MRKFIYPSARAAEAIPVEALLRSRKKGSILIWAWLFGLALWPGSDLQAQIFSQARVVSVPIEQEELFYSPSAFVGFTRGGKMLLATNELGSQGGLYLRSLGQNMLPDGRLGWHFPDEFLQSWVLHADGTLALLLASVNPADADANPEHPTRLDLVKIDSLGKTLFRQRLVGHQGRGPGAYWLAEKSDALLAWNGSRYSVYLDVERHWSENGQSQVHSGDLFFQLDPSGRLIEGTKDMWGASHSSQLQLAHGPQGQALTLTSADMFPFGLQFRNYQERLRQVIWPRQSPPDYLPQTTTDAGWPDGLWPTPEAVFATVSAPDQYPFDPYKGIFRLALLKIGYDGKLLEQYWLTPDDGVGRLISCSVPVQDRFLLVWTEYRGSIQPEGAAHMALVNRKGQIVRGPHRASFRARPNTSAFLFPNGDIGLVGASYYGQCVEIVRIPKG